MTNERVFPMQSGPDVPWSVAEVIYAAYAEVYPSSARQQSIERMAERGGFGWGEAAYLLDELWKRNQKKYNQLLPGKVGHN